MESKYDFIVNTAQRVDSKWSNADKVRFHYFNPNGLYARHQAIFNRIVKVVEQGGGEFGSGALLAYDGAYYIRWLRALHGKKRVKSSELKLWEQSFKEAQRHMIHRLREKGFEVSE